MPVPSMTTFDRLRTLAALEDPDGRQAAPVREVFTGKQITTIPIGTAEDVLSAITKARAAQIEWAAQPITERARILERFRDLVLADRDTIMDVAQAETGKARWSALEEVLNMVLNSRYYAQHGPALLRPRRVQGALPGLTKAVVNHQPKGVVGIIAPWNYPMALSISDAIPALMAGNAVVIKPDSRTPYCTLVNADLLYRAGLPRELLAVVPGPGSVVGSAIAEHCDYLMFTGSSATGRLLAEQCARRLIGISAELGGKNPMIVARGANIDRVAKAATRACFGNAGQLCISIERIYVEARIFEEFIEKFAAATRSLKLGTHYDFTDAIGSLICADQLNTVDAHVEDAKAKGATVIAGGRARPDIGPHFYEPTILTGVTDEMVCARTETFGPVVSVYRVADIEDAIARANDSEYGLNASVWAGSDAEGERIAARLRTGSVNVNEGYGPSMASLAAPMGGMRSSGLGRRHGPDGLLKYTEPQTVATTRLLGLDPPFGIPDHLWQASMAPLFQLIQRLPGR
ncbi:MULTISPECIES: succinic semialdehyde dehydrogenase [unclassified Nocardia]|uniref:succinic semialdehyde dehydrogenase n=1 Tax=unclassified Nocardia TaxID=2637762 RepID=UPI0035DF4CF6